MAPRVQRYRPLCVAYLGKRVEQHQEKTTRGSQEHEYSSFHEDEVNFWSLQNICRLFEDYGTFEPMKLLQRLLG
jgi:hypothetical protein